MKAGGKSRAERVYALYRGDEFLDVGTAEELSARTGMKADEIAKAPRRKTARVMVFLIKVNCKEENE